MPGRRVGRPGDLGALAAEPPILRRSARDALGLPELGLPVRAVHAGPRGRGAGAAAQETRPGRLTTGAAPIRLPGITRPSREADRLPGTSYGIATRTIESKAVRN